MKEVQIGQEVVIADLGQTATVTARPDRNGMVEVRAGIMKTKVPLSNLRAPDKMEKRKPAEPRRSTRVQLDKSPQGQYGAQPAGLHRGRGPERGGQVPGQWYAARAVRRSTSSTATAPARCARPSKSTCAPTRRSRASAWAAMARAKAA